MSFELQKKLGTNAFKSIVFIFISLVGLAGFVESLYPLVFIVAMTGMSMAGQRIYKSLGGKRCIHCNSQIVSTVRPYHNSRIDICDTCQMWQSFMMTNEQEHAYQEDIARAQETKAEAKARAERQARARAEERERRQEQRTRPEQESPKPKPEQAFDPYYVLGVIRGASKQEIKTAYHKLMKVYHPDMVAHLGLEAQKIAADKALAINRAYEKIGN
jgi:DnaJ domain